MSRLTLIAQIALSLGAVWWFMRNDVADYAAFKLLTRSADRQRRFLVWTFKGFVLFFGLGLVNLIILGRLRAAFAFPVEFEALSFPLRSVFSRVPMLRTGLLVGMGCGVLVGVILGAVLNRKQKKGSPSYAENIEPLLPRNGAETACAGLMSVNAGVSEELFFRLVLPLLLVLLFGNGAICFIVAAIIFGFCHWYQGPAGIAATTVLGLGLTAIYLGTGSLLTAVAVHAGLDLFNLIVRPWLQKALSAALPARG